MATDRSHLNVSQTKLDLEGHNIGFCRCAIRSMELGHGSAGSARCAAHGRPRRSTV
jgi:hypothetical protein